jgi:integrase
VARSTIQDNLEWARAAGISWPLPTEGLAWHHGLRVSELIAWRWSDINWKRADIALNL